MKYLITESQLKLLFNSNGQDFIFESPLDDFKTKYVGVNKQLPESLFDEIKELFNNKTNIIIWVVKNIINGLISYKDIYKFKDYFKIFDNYRSNFKINSISSIKTESDLYDFVEKCLDIQKNTDLGESYVSYRDILKLKDVGISYLGVEDGYQIFEVPSSLRESEKAFNTYRNILGRCKNRETEKVSFCTVAHYRFFKSYLRRDSLFVLFNMDDPMSPYQVFGLRGKEFKGRDNKPIPPEQSSRFIDLLKKKLS